MSLSTRLSSYIGPVLILSIGAVTVASAQSASPFASKKKKQAWETAAPAASAPNPAAQYESAPQARPQYQAPPNYQPQPQYQAPAYNAPNQYAPKRQMPSGPATADPKAYYPGRAQQPKPAANISNYESKPFSASGAAKHNAAQFAGAASPAASAAANSQIMGSEASGPQAPGSQWGGYAPSPLRDKQIAQNYEGSSYGKLPNAAPAQNSYQGQGYGGPRTYTSRQKMSPPPRSWKDRLGLGKLATLFRGKARVGAAASELDGTTRDGWGEQFIADGDVEFEVSAVTQGGLEYGINLGARAQYDKYRRGFGGRISDCPAGTAGCASTLVGAAPAALRGHTSRFYSGGIDDAKSEEAALESAYVFLRSPYGDFTAGRDDGAAYLFSLGAPSLLAVGASNSPVDYAGLDSVKTVNDASGFAEKVTYTSPRLLGDTVGVGVQFGASYAPDARACGVDYCVRKNDVTGTVSPDLRDIVEVGVALDRTFTNGLKVEGTATYARGNETSGLAALDDLSAYNAGVEVSLADWTVGGSWLKSNNGLADGDYEAWDMGLTWKPSQLGFTLGYGQAVDDNVRLKANQAIFGVSYEFDKFTLGTGVQYMQRKTPLLNGAILEMNKERATTVFVEGGFKF